MERDEARARLLAELSRHVGDGEAIGMGELFQAVFQTPWRNRINDTRALRAIVTELREDGVAICSDDRGYWLAAAGAELEDYCRRLRASALRKLRQEARLRRLALPQLMGQMALELGAEGPANEIA
jgi:hypothetical protein